MKQEKFIHLNKIAYWLKNIRTHDTVSPDIEARLTLSRKSALDAFKVDSIDSRASLIETILSTIRQTRSRVALTFVMASIMAAFMVFPQTSSIIEQDKIDSISNYSMNADDLNLEMENI